MTLCQVSFLIIKSPWSCMYAYLGQNIITNLLSFGSISSITKDFIIVSDLDHHSYLSSYVHFAGNHFCVHYETYCRCFCSLALGCEHLFLAWIGSLFYHLTYKLICSILEHNLPYNLLEQYNWSNFTYFGCNHCHHGFLLLGSYPTCFINC